MTSLDPAPRVLCVNAGSRSLKVSAFAVRRGDLEPAGVATLALDSPNAEAYVAALERAVGELELQGPCAVGHRIVHGGPHHTAPCLVTDVVVGELERLVSLAPLHQPPALQLLAAARARWGHVPHVACFDTAFHAALPEVARRLPLPARFADVRRYGFHGLSYEHVVASLGERLGRRTVVAHLGGGASLVALHDGRPVDTTMGFSPAGGIPMATRPGDLDPGALLHLARSPGMTLDRLEHLLTHESGLLAVGGSGDVQKLLARRGTDAHADLALALFVQGVRKAIGAFAAVLGGLDSLVFTGGVGEHAATLRAEICQPLAFLGVKLDAAKNGASETRIDAAASDCTVHVVESREDLVIAHHTLNVASFGRSAGRAEGGREPGSSC